MPVTNFLIKPSSHLCNIDCAYCFYKRAADVYPGTESKMAPEAVHAFLEKALGQGPGRYSFCWQGGEPTLMGLDFFEHVVRTQHQLAGPGQVIENSIQTNGLLLNRDWAHFLRKNRFLVGLSLDGPKDIHDRYRVAYSGEGTFDKVLDAARLMSDTGVDFNILTLLTNANIHEPKRLYRFYRENGFGHLQFIPCLEKDEAGAPRPFTVSGGELGVFYMDLFDMWLDDGFPTVSIRLFEDILLYLLDGIHASCGWQGRCDSYLLVEHSGDCYPCDFFMYPQWLLGNVVTDSMEDIIGNPVRTRFANLKADFGPACRTCQYFAFCQGDCTRHRLTGENRFGAKSEYCEAWKAVLDHITGHPKNVKEMAMAARQAHQSGVVVKTGRNQPCPCGSGKKFKKCCGRAAG